MSRRLPVGEVPAAVAAALAGTPVVGTTDQCFPLLTSQPGSPVHVCLLSRAELRAAPGRILAVTASSRAAANLASGQPATLLVVSGASAYSLSLRQARSRTDDRFTAHELAVEDVEEDSLGVPLQPMGFQVAARLAVEERWERTSALLDRLLSGDAA